MADLSKILEFIFELRYFSPDEAIGGQTAIPYVWDKGTSRLVLVQGENAGGKSFFRRLLRAVTAPPRAGRGYDAPPSAGGPFPIPEIIHLSMQGRTDNGVGMMPIARAMVYGDESWHATGVLTASTIEGAIKTATGRDHGVSIYWDEPDIGMSAAAAAGAGVRIREFVDTLPANSYWAARSLGATRWRAFVRVTLPQLQPALRRGAALAVASSLGEFAVTLFLSRPEWTTVGTLIYQYLGRPGAANFEAAILLSGLLLGVTLLLFWLIDPPTDKVTPPRA